MRSLSPRESRLLFTPGCVPWWSPLASLLSTAAVVVVLLWPVGLTVPDAITVTASIVLLSVVGTTSAPKRLLAAVKAATAAQAGMIQ
ncbi:hypothetical protein L6E12_27005 [Actinokineospora sp. PR83]|uniref:hypothetical protein n=1 Tax=Actinokineospora sp. PR83 TaxID=2884908 RepID=UPI001F2EC4C2|nr:hypothetical protein [Actinokineospora sp. PR83]MCG8919430.1 hypothetical protein [Actinokineospora sp. PR83]